MRDPRPPRADGRLAENIVHFARALRRAGLSAPPGRVAEAVEAVAAAGFTSKTDFYWALHACFVRRPEDRAPFRAVFQLFWRDPQVLEQMISVLLRQARAPADERAPNAADRRAQEAMAGDDAPEAPRREDDDDKGEEVEIDMSLTFSAQERLKSLDFEQMSAAEITAAKAALARLSLPVRPIRSRRTAPDPRGAEPDWRASLRAALRAGGAVPELRRRAPKIRWPALVALCDISGSMAGYSRMLLHFLHAVAAREGPGWSHVHAFTFGTRLTNITRHLRARDVDAALAAAGAEAQDWEGGTRIGETLRVFNRDWSRRVLGQGAVVLLITDGLDRGDPQLLADEADRLRRSARQLVWLNPLLRWDGFAPRAQGVRALLPRVDSFRAAHNIDSLETLADALSRPEDGGERARLMAAMADPAGGAP